MQNLSVVMMSSIPKGVASAVAKNMMPADRMELMASHPGRDLASLIRQFIAQSQEHFSFIYRGKPTVAGGITRQGCIWMVTTSTLYSCPKTFVGAARRWLTEKLLFYPVLFNWVDENHHTAQRFIAYLGGVFTGEYQILSGQKFLFFMFRRDYMGGIIQAGRTYTSTAAQALAQYKKKKNYFREQADQFKADNLQTQLDNALQTNYLFRSSAERSRLLEAAARKQRSTLQNMLAHNGLDTSSATVQLLLEKNKLAAAQEQSKIAQEVSDQVSAADKETAQKIAALREQEHLARKKANQKSTVWKMTKKLFSWFK